MVDINTNTSTPISRGTIALLLLAIVLLIAVGTLGWILASKNKKITEQTTLIDHITDTLKVTKNNKGQLVAQISALQTSNVKDFLKIKNLTGINKQLQDLVNVDKKKLGSQGSVTIIGDDVRVDTIVKTIVIPKDTVIAKGKNNTMDTLKLYPEYRASINRGIWFTDTIVANKDSISIDPKFHNEYHLLIGEETEAKSGLFGTNLFGKKIPYSEVTNLNPYSSNPILRTYSLKNTISPKPFGLGLVGGWGGQFFNHQINTGWFIGIGASYNFIRF